MPALALILLLMAPGAALAHGNEGDQAYMAWTFDSWIVTPLLLAGALYGSGYVRLGWQCGFRRVRLWQMLAYAAGWMSLAAALISPLHWLGERLFTFHMIEHEIVMAVAAPLIVLARPAGVLLLGLPERVRSGAVTVLRQQSVRMIWRSLSSGASATLLHGIAIWFWHVPGWFDAAVANVLVHRLQHLSFFLTGVLFWWAVLRSASYGRGAWHVFITMLHTSALGALMALAPRVLYTQQTSHSAEWGLSALQDQQLAGIVMWVPAGTVYAGAALALTALWIKRSSAYAEGGHARPVS